MLVLRPATPADLDRLVAVYFSAFAGNPVQEVLFPDSAEGRAFWRRTLADNLADPYARFWVVVDDAGADQAASAHSGDAARAASTADDDILAFAVWNAPRPAAAPFGPPPPADLAAWPQDGDPAAAVAFFGDLAAQHARLMAPHGPHWYLELIATARAAQGRGAAGLLLRWGEAQADAEGVPCYLDATPAGRRVYASARHGFAEVDVRTYRLGPAAYEQVFMIREAGGGKGEA